MEGKPFEMDFGWIRNINNGQKTYKLQKLPDANILPTNIQLMAYSGNIFPALGVVNVSIAYDGKSMIGKLFIVDDKFDLVFGREWTNPLQLLPLLTVQNITTEKIDVINLENYIFADLNYNTIGTIPIEGKLKLREGVCLQFISNRGRFHTQCVI